MIDKHQKIHEEGKSIEIVITNNSWGKLKLNFQYRRIFQLFITTNIAEMKFNK
jgi:hypothetical protein